MISAARGIAVATLVFTAVCLPASAAAQRPATVPRGALRADTVWSQSLGVRKRVLTYLPPAYARDTARRFPVLLYLHGLTGSEDDWLRQARLDHVMDSLAASGAPEAIVVMPDGDDSWYTTWHVLPNVASCQADRTRQEPAATFCVPWPHYDDYVARDLVGWLDSTFRTIPEPAHRGIGGLSMGGYGAVTLALRYPDVFSAAASHSGVLAPALLGPHPFVAPARWARTPAELRQAAGARFDWFAEPFGRDTIGWFARDPSHLAARLVTAGTAVPALFLDCGRDDPFLDQNRAFVATLSALGLSYRYDELPGGHTWTYWRLQLPHSLTWLLGRVAGTVTPDGAPADGAPPDSA